MISISIISAKKFIDPCKDASFRNIIGCVFFRPQYSEGAKKLNWNQANIAGLVGNLLK